MSNQPELPKYRSHKEVGALKIAKLEPNDEGALITPEDRGYIPIQVSKEYVEKHSPKAGGYFVQYKDGYQSFSPSQAFEEGYRRLGPGDPSAEAGEPAEDSPE